MSSPTPKAFFVTGTDTGVGKTHVSVSLTKALVEHGLRVAVMKPIASGSEHTPAGLRNTDALALAAVSNVQVPYSTVNPYCFEPAISPHIAAEEAKVAVDVSTIKAAFNLLSADADVTVVEGAGGWYAPINSSQSMADLARALDVPAILVVGVRLGCLNHAQLSKQAIEARGVKFAGWVANAIDPMLERAAANLATLTRLLGSEPLAVFPFAMPTWPQPLPQSFPLTSAQAAQQGALPSRAAAESTPAGASPNVRCGEHIARRLSLISF